MGVCASVSLLLVPKGQRRSYEPDLRPVMTVMTIDVTMMTAREMSIWS